MSLGDLSTLTSLTVNLSFPGTFRVFALELAGVGGDAWTSYGGQMESENTVTSAAPAMDMCPGNVVVSTIVGCGALGPLTGASSFTDVGVQQDGDVAYTVTGSEGSYTAEWTSTGGPWSSFSLGFMPQR